MPRLFDYLASSDALLFCTGVCQKLLGQLWSRASAAAAPLASRSTLVSSHCCSIVTISIDFGLEPLLLHHHLDRLKSRALAAALSFPRWTLVSIPCCCIIISIDLSLEPLLPHHHFLDGLLVSMPCCCIITITEPFSLTLLDGLWSRALAAALLSPRVSSLPFSMDGSLEPEPSRLLDSRLISISSLVGLLLPDRLVQIELPPDDKLSLLTTSCPSQLTGHPTLDRGHSRRSLSSFNTAHNSLSSRPPVLALNALASSIAVLLGSLSADVVLVSWSGGSRLRGVLLAVSIGLSFHAVFPCGLLICICSLDCHEARHRSRPFVTNSIGGKGSGAQPLALCSCVESLNFAPVVSSSSAILCLR